SPVIMSRFRFNSFQNGVKLPSDLRYGLAASRASEYVKLPGNAPHAFLRFSEFTTNGRLRAKSSLTSNHPVSLSYSSAVAPCSPVVDGTNSSLLAGNP